MLAAGVRAEGSHPLRRVQRRGPLGKFLASLRPASDRKGHGGPRHDQCRQTDGHDESEHGIQVVLLEGGDRVLVALHEDDSARAEAERCDELARWTGRIVRRRWRDEEDQVGHRSRKSETHEERSPLLMDHGCYHGALMMRAHHESQQ
jgi:hypothetical protein